MDKARSVLKQIFGYDTFRPLQEYIIKNILSGKDSLVIMPTGGGKSLCYQIPALLFEGLTVVLSPLISLMKDQVEQLRQAGVQAALLNSSLSQQVYNTNYISVSTGKAKLLYLAPESLGRDDIQGLLKNVKLSCITVDEAHCISEWGHDFRPDYRQIGTLRKKFPGTVCIALTATATPRVQDDIIKNLDMHTASRFIASFNRENLFLQVIPKRNSFNQTLDFINDHKGQSGIIYCFSRKQVDELHEDLSALGYSTKPYHAGLSDEERNKNQDLFIKDEVQIIIATIAFGMGINKSNVRFVLHHDLPKNIESYYQEIGRSGRDGLRSDCLLLFSYGDISKINYFIDQKEDPVERNSAKLHLDAMVKYAESEVCRRITLINYFGEKYSVDNCGICDNCLGDERELTDITVHSQKFLSAVKRTREIFGANYIIDVLTGTDNDRILSNRHHDLSVFGIGSDLDKKQWMRISHQLVNKQLLSRDPEFGSLKLTEKAYRVLLKNEKVYGSLIEKKITARKPKVSTTEYDEDLFELLRKTRKEIADSMGVPPYVIFSDKSLIQMAVDYPVTTQAFSLISGVGGNKLHRYGSTFMQVIGDYCRSKNIKPRNIEKASRVRNVKEKPKYIKTAEAFNSGVSLSQLVEEFDVKPSTIINHLARYVNEGHTLRTEGIEEAITITREKLLKVLKEIGSLDDFSLKPVFDKFNGEIGYDDLHLARLLFIVKSRDRL